MGEQDEEKSPNSLRYYAPRRPRETDGPDVVRPDQPAPADGGNVSRLSTVVDHGPGGQSRHDMFTEAVARADRKRLDPEFVTGPPFVEPRRTSSIGVKFATVTTAVALATLAYVFAFPMAGVKTRVISAWSGFRPASSPASPASPAPTLIVRGNSGPLNAQLDLGVMVENPAAGMVVIVNKVPFGTRMTAGRRIGPEEWRVPATDMASAAIVPPSDFAGELNLPLELHDADGTTLVKSFVHLTWIAPPSPVVVTGSTAAAAVDPKVVPQEAPPAVAPPPPAAAAPPPPPVPASPDPVLAWTPNEVAGFVRRAQELLASGEVQTARLQLLRAAEAHDPRAALLLAKTFDPMALKQFGVADAGTDLAQARTWYQRAREWGSPEAQRQLDALASYPRR